MKTTHSHTIVYSIQGNCIDRADTAGCNGCGWREKATHTLNTDSRNYLVEKQNGRRYIVRRLTPLECCRLQGFPDGWDEIPDKQQFTDEDVEFWNGVRSTYARINGKAYKPTKRGSLLRWYNKLGADSARYKMWGNGIALPCAEFVLGRIAEHEK